VVELQQPEGQELAWAQELVRVWSQTLALLEELALA
jgi:hypothetical protein